MFAGHFAPITVLHSRYPTVSPYVLTFGVCLLDLTFGVLALFGVEKFTTNENAGVLGVDIHCYYSHSLVGSVILSALYALVTGSSVPGFLASFSHFVLDWLVHNSDLLLDPFSRIIVGGTGLWGAHPTITFYAEALLCVCCMLYASKDKWTMLANTVIIIFHYENANITPPSLSAILNMDKIPQQWCTGLFTLFEFMIPAMAVGYMLQQARNHENKTKKD